MCDDNHNICEASKIPPYHWYEWNDALLLFLLEFRIYDNYPSICVKPTRPTDTNCMILSPKPRTWTVLNVPIQLIDNTVTIYTWMRRKAFWPYRNVEMIVASIIAGIGGRKTFAHRQNWGIRLSSVTLNGPVFKAKK